MPIIIPDIKKYVPNTIADVFCILLFLQLLQLFFSIYKKIIKNKYNYDFILCKQKIII